MAADGTIWIKMAVQGAADVKREMDKAGASVKDFGKQTETAGKGVANFGNELMGIIGTATAVAGTIALLERESIKFTDAMSDMATQTGISVNKLMELRLASAKAGADFGTVTQGITKWTMAVEEARTPTSELAKTFSQLGVNPYGEDYETMFLSTASAIAEIDSVALRNSISMQLYGRSWKDVNEAMAEYNTLSDDVKESTHISEQAIRGNADALKFLGGMFEYAYTTGMDYIGQFNDSVFNAGQNYRDSMYKNYKAGVMDAKEFQDKTNISVEEYEKLLNKGAPEVKKFTEVNKSLFLGMSDTELQLYDLRQELKDYTKAMENAEVAGNQQQYDIAAKGYQKVSNAINALTTNATIAETAVAKLQSSMPQDWAAGAVGSAGSNMNLFLEKEMAKGTSYQDALNAWAQGAPTNDIGAAYKAGNQSGFGKSVMATKAIDAESDSLSKLSETYNSKYDEIEVQSLEHYTYLGEIARTFYQGLMDYHYKTTDYISNEVQYIQKIEVVNGKKQAEPIKFVAKAPPVLAAIDYSKVSGGAAAAAAVASKEAAATAAASGTVKVEITTADTLTAKVSATGNIAAGMSSTSGGGIF